MQYRAKGRSKTPPSDLYMYYVMCVAQKSPNQIINITYTRITRIFVEQLLIFSHLLKLFNLFSHFVLCENDDVIMLLPSKRMKKVLAHAFVENLRASAWQRFKRCGGNIGSRPRSSFLKPRFYPV